LAIGVYGYFEFVYARWNNPVRDQAPNEPHAAMAPPREKWTKGVPSPTNSQVAANTNATANERYFTMGSTREEVLALHGKPNSSDEHELMYTTSKVLLKDG